MLDALRRRMDHRAVRESTVLRWVTRLKQRLVTVVAGSRVGTVLSALRGRSTVDPLAEQPLESSRAVRNSRVLNGLRKASNGIRRTGSRSYASHVLAGSKRAITGSRLYQWLTAEPEPDVVVIDLRQTTTIGPVLTAIQRFVVWLLPATASSALFRAGRRVQRVGTRRPVQFAGLLTAATVFAVTALAALSGRLSATLFLFVTMLSALAVICLRIDWSWQQLRATQGYQWLATAFEPPEPPSNPGDTDTNEVTDQPADPDENPAKTAGQSTASDDQFDELANQCGDDSEQEHTNTGSESSCGKEK